VVEVVEVEVEVVHSVLSTLSGADNGCTRAAGKGVAGAVPRRVRWWRSVHTLRKLSAYAGLPRPCVQTTTRYTTTTTGKTGRIGAWERQL
jgi:hypothetical protein